jgi:DNA-directed RNA polymerase subunit RPC12/RpoP
MSDSEQIRGLCNICWDENELIKTKFYYPIACHCCSPVHFSIVYHCATCTPKPPIVTELQIATAKLLDPIFEDLFKQSK